MENDTAACSMNQRGYSDGDLGAIVNPHNIARPDSLEKRAKNITYHPAVE
jgi:hypothetical protein